MIWILLCIIVHILNSIQNNLFLLKHTDFLLLYITVMAENGLSYLTSVPCFIGPKIIIVYAKTSPTFFPREGYREKRKKSKTKDQESPVIRG